MGVRDAHKRKENKEHRRDQLGLSLPETRSNPEDNCFKNTTLFPLNLPANNIRTVPGVMLALSLGGFLTGVGPFLNTTSSAG